MALLEMVMDELDHRGALAHGGRDALYRPVPDVARGEDTWDAGLEQPRGPFERPGARRITIEVEVEDDKPSAKAVQPLREDPVIKSFQKHLGGEVVESRKR